MMICLCSLYCALSGTAHPPQFRLSSEQLLQKIVESLVAERDNIRDLTLALQPSIIIIIPVRLETFIRVLLSSVNMPCPLAGLFSPSY